MISPLVEGAAKKRNNKRWSVNQMSRYHKRHYEDVAKIINSLHNCRCGPEGQKPAWWILLRSRFASMFEKDNPLFNRERFYGACDDG